MSVVIWTADHPRWVKRATKLGIKAIITNDPARLIAVRKSRPHEFSSCRSCLIPLPHFAHIAPSAI